METSRLKTAFAAAEKANEIKVLEQSKLFEDNAVIGKFANAIGKMLLVLNQQRQIVFANQLFMDFLGFKNVKDVLGKRPGDALKCVHAEKAQYGCGTTEFCKMCGAVRAILHSQKGQVSEQECRISTINSEALDLRVIATPYQQNEENFTIFAISDISNEKRRQLLERVFFHDVLNSASAISGISYILQEIDNPDEIMSMAKTLNRSADILIDEIISQRTLTAAERGDIELSFSTTGSFETLHDLAEMYDKHEISQNKDLALDPDSQNVGLVTDTALLRRIIANMVKNALEASMPGGTVSLKCIEDEKTVTFSIHNSTFMSRDVQLQLFKRSFTTKGVGRGIGTYSMKLFGEKYLKGKVWFTSSEQEGTTFFLQIPKHHPEAK